MDKKQRAEHAKRLMNDPLITEFFENYSKVLYNKWVNSKSVEEREAAHQLQVAGTAFRVQMSSYLADGRVEEENGGSE